MAPAANACPQCGATIDGDAERAACERCGQPADQSKTTPPLDRTRDAPPIEAPPLVAPPGSRPSGQNLDPPPTPSELASLPTFPHAGPLAGETDLPAKDKKFADFESVQIQATVPARRREGPQRPLRRLSHEERAIRRARMNVIMLALGFTVLVMTLAVLLYLTGG